MDIPPQRQRVYHQLMHWWGEADAIITFDGTATARPSAFASMDVAVWRARERGDVTIFNTMGMSDRRMPGADHLVELNLGCRRKLKEPDERGLATLLANITEYPFANNAKLDWWERLVDLGLIPVFDGCTHVLRSSGRRAGQRTRSLSRRSPSTKLGAKAGPRKNSDARLRRASSRPARGASAPPTCLLQASLLHAKSVSPKPVAEPQSARPSEAGRRRTSDAAIRTPPAALLDERDRRRATASARRRTICHWIPTASPQNLHVRRCARQAVPAVLEQDATLALWRLLCSYRCTMQGIGKRFVYVLRSGSDPKRHYVGVTSDVDTRLEWHNHGPCGHTTEHRPWSLVVIIEFPTERQAVCFEKYLKTGSGRAFAKRHLC